MTSSSDTVSDTQSREVTTIPPNTTLTAPDMSPTNSLEVGNATGDASATTIPLNFTDGKGGSDRSRISDTADSPGASSASYAGTVDAAEPPDVNLTARTTVTQGAILDSVDSSVAGFSGSLVVERILASPERERAATRTLNRTTAATTSVPSHWVDDATETATVTDEESIADNAGVGSLRSGTSSEIPTGPVPSVTVIGFGAVLAGAVGRHVAGAPMAVRDLSPGARHALDRLFRVFTPLRYSRYDDSDPLETSTAGRSSRPSTTHPVFT